MINRTIPITEINNICKYFHLAFKDKRGSDSLTTILEPRLPRRPYEDNYDDVIEDWFTPRRSFAPNIQSAVKALGASEILYVFGANELNGFIDVATHCDNVNNRLKYKDRERGITFYKADSHGVSRWEARPFILQSPLFSQAAKEKIYKYDYSAQMIPQYQKLLIHCVPDANITGEVWATKPTKVYYLGIIDFPYNKVLIDAAAAQNISQLIKTPY